MADTEIEVRRSSEEFAKAVVAAALVITEEAASAKRDSEEFKALAAEAAKAAKAELSLARDAALEAQQMADRLATRLRKLCMASLDLGVAQHSGGHDDDRDKDADDDIAGARVCGRGGRGWTEVEVAALRAGVQRHGEAPAQVRGLRPLVASV